MHKYTLFSYPLILFTGGHDCIEADGRQGPQRVGYTNGMSFQFLQKVKKIIGSVKLIKLVTYMDVVYNGIHDLLEGLILFYLGRRTK